jgi:hypothetical protein
MNLQISYRRNKKYYQQNGGTRNGPLFILFLILWKKANFKWLDNYPILCNNCALQGMGKQSCLGGSLKNNSEKERKMSDRMAITGRMKVGKIIVLKGKRAKKIIEDYFFDFKALPRGAKKITLGKAAQKCAREYKIEGALEAINRLFDVQRKKREKKNK